MFRFMLICSCLSMSFAATLTPNRLRVEYMVEPRGVDEPQPRFSWALASDDRGQAQTAYQIVVKSEDAGSTVVFDSGKVMSNRSTNVVLALPAAASGHQFNATTQYSWAVTAWDSAGVKGPASAPAHFSTGVQGDWKNAAIDGRGYSKAHCCVMSSPCQAA